MLQRAGTLCVIALLGGCSGSAVPESATGQPSAAGWEVRYNAAMAFARRGSDKFLDPVVQDLMKELLDEQQQLANFRNTLPDGREVRDPQAARAAVIGAMKSIADFHEQQPKADISGLKPAIEKLSTSPNRVVAAEAKSLLTALAK